MSPKRSRWLFIPAFLLLYAAVGVLVSYWASRSGTYPAGADTMFYVYRGDFLYRSITEDGNWFPLIDMQWYNGVQTWRYWSPLSAYILAGCQALAGGNSFDGYLVFVGLLYVANAVVWLRIGWTHDRPLMGGFLGLLWFFIPNNLFMLFIEGVLARCMSMPLLPLFVFYVYDYLLDRKWSSLPKLILSFAAITMCHSGWSGMLAITLLIFFLFYLIFGEKEHRGSMLLVLLAVALGYVVTGVWLYASLNGGIVTQDSSSTMAKYFQSLNLTINPFIGWKEGAWNRWDYVEGSAYFGFAAFLLAVFGVLFSRRRAWPAFATALSICLLTTTVAYPLLSRLPGGQFLWMLRFLSIALTFLIAGFFLWNTLKPKWQACFAVLLVMECACALPLLLHEQDGTTPHERYDVVEETTLIGEGKSITAQRMSIVEPFNTVLDGIYVAAGYGENAVPSSYGQGIQAAMNRLNLVQINQAGEGGWYLYMFDRLLELGNDTVLFPAVQLKHDQEEVDPKQIADLDAAASRVGYQLVASNEDYRLYHMDTPDTFGIISKYRAIGIGTDSPVISLIFPTVEETTSTNLNDYTFEQLSQYEVVYLAGFTYDDKESAEQLVLDLSEAGVRVIIMADGIPDEEHTATKTFLGVSCNSVTFKQGYPELDTIDGTLYCDLFPSGHTDWKTVYVNGLDEVWGTISDFEYPMDFYGTVKNDNIIVIGLGLTYFYSLTLDEGVGMLLSHAITIGSDELPQRTIVPLSIDYRDNVITIQSAADNVNTTLAMHDIFDTEQEISEQNHMLCVNKGTTVIQLHYPYLLEGCLVTAVGLVLSAVFLYVTRKWDRKEREKQEAQKASDVSSEQGEQRT